LNCFSSESVEKPRGLQESCRCWTIRTKKTPGHEVEAFFGVADGTRTHDNWNHNPGLYQLSYSHH
jgi:hypothetical protein